MNSAVKQLVKEKREELGFTQSKLAEKLGVSRSVITMIESDDNYRPSIDTAKKLSEALSLKWTIFFED